jgi:AcrR family transcriptional regulator
VAIRDPRQERTRKLGLSVARQLLLSDGIGSITHLRVAAAGGGARRTLYRHWPTSNDLLRETLAGSSATELTPTTDLRSDLVTHLAAFQVALHDGPLGYIICAIGERAAIDPTFEPLQSDLATTGCKPLRDRLRQARQDSDLPAGIDIRTAQCMLEGPVLYSAILERRRLPASAIRTVVATVLRGPTV